MSENNQGDEMKLSLFIGRLAMLQETGNVRKALVHVVRNGYRKDPKASSFRMSRSFWSV
jgi:hypothetical protein